MLLQRFLDAGLLDQEARVDILLTKWDLLRTDGAGAVALPYEVTVKDTVRRRLSGKVARFDFHRVAACPSARPELGEAYGVESLLTGWLAEGGRHWPLGPREPVETLPLREMARYCERGFSEGAA